MGSEKQIKASDIVNKPVDDIQRIDYERTFDGRMADGEVKTEEVTLGGIPVGQLDVTGREQLKDTRFGA